MGWRRVLNARAMMREQGTLLDQAVTLGRQGESPLYRAEALDALGSLLARTPRGDQNGAAEQREATEIYEALSMRRAARRRRGGRGCRRSG